MSFIEINALTKHYPMGNNSLAALRGVSLHIEQGERVFFCGPSGSGKSTLMHIIGCLDSQHGGRLSIAGQDMHLLSDQAMADFRAKHIGFVFQNFNLLPVLNVYENVQYPLLLKGGLKVGEQRQRIQAILAAVGLADQMQRYPNELSGGQQQRVAIARALVHYPKLLIVDEPTANLDSATGDAIMDLLLQLSENQGSTLIVCSHNPELLKKAERFVMLRDGLVVGDRKPALHVVEREKVYAAV